MRLFHQRSEIGFRNVVNIFILIEKVSETNTSALKKKKRTSTHLFRNTFTFYYTLKYKNKLKQDI